LDLTPGRPPASGVAAGGRHLPVAGEDAIPESEPSWATLGRFGRENIVVVAVQVVAWAGLLTLADDARLPWLARAAAVILFCLTMQGVFTMVHEFCHRNAHRNALLNYLLGFVTCTIFGTAPTLLRVEHWGHHRRNRAESERGEFIHPGESAFGKTVTYYVAILGGIWLGCFVFPIVSLLVPYRVAKWLARRERFNTFAVGLGEFKARDWWTMRLEGAWMIVFWTTLVLVGPWRWQTLAVAYGAFAFSWSSLQWIYHMHTPINVVEGAYNLRAPSPLRVLFLNFNYNLTHHRHPAMPWQELHRQSDRRETQPLWYRYALVFRPPVPLPEDLSVLEKRYF
jgi:fatty acid desaturase